MKHDTDISLAEGLLIVLIAFILLGLLPATLHGVL